MTNRKEEIRSLMQLSPNKVIELAGNHIVVCDDLDALHQRFAEDIASEILTNNQKGINTRLILPVGPTGQYPILSKIIVKENISLKNCWFFFMDEYCGDNGKAVPPNHPLSFKKIAKSLFLDSLIQNDLQQKQIYFPNENNISELASIIANIGGIDTCYGGIGIHGHIAFNEPEPGVSQKGPRKVKLNDFTITINSIRSQVGGNLENFPHEAYTLGMTEILYAKRIRLYCRNGTPYDWANTILRIALFGTPGDDYPVTYIRNHSDYVITTDKDTLVTPKKLL
ncbi:MAG: 6-phosphogluconolactonase [Candidatus Hermodarchaeota archaeon]